ncbi:hypothetical protein HK405_006589, partial [Cladochytrium tenue]
MQAGRSVVRSVKNFAKGYSEVQVKVRALFTEITEILEKRLNDSAKNWRHVYKSLLLLDCLIHTGSDGVITYAKQNIFIIKTLKEFQALDDDGRDQGMNSELQLLVEGGLTRRITQAQRLNDYEVEQPKGLRKGYMGHLTYIADEVVKLIEKCTPEFRPEIRPLLVDETWPDYVTGALQSTKQRDAAALGGVRPNQGALPPPSRDFVGDDPDFPVQATSVAGAAAGAAGTTGSVANTSFSTLATAGGDGAKAGGGGGGDSEDEDDESSVAALVVADGDVETEQFARFLCQQMVMDLPDCGILGDDGDSGYAGENSGPLLETVDEAWLVYVYQKCFFLARPALNHHRAVSVSSREDGSEDTRSSAATDLDAPLTPVGSLPRRSLRQSALSGPALEPTYDDDDDSGGSGAVDEDGVIEEVNEDLGAEAASGRLSTSGTSATSHLIAALSLRASAEDEAALTPLAAVPSDGLPPPATAPSTQPPPSSSSSSDGRRLNGEIVSVQPSRHRRRLKFIPVFLATTMTVVPTSSKSRSAGGGGRPGRRAVAAPFNLIVAGHSQTGKSSFLRTLLAVLDRRAAAADAGPADGPSGIARPASRSASRSASRRASTFTGLESTVSSGGLRVVWDESLSAGAPTTTAGPAGTDRPRVLPAAAAVVGPAPSHARIEFVEPHGGVGGGGERITLRVVDTPGLVLPPAMHLQSRHRAALNPEAARAHDAELEGVAARWLAPVLAYVEAQYEATLAEESRVRRNPRFPDSLVHACLYFLDPAAVTAARGLTQLDCYALRALSSRVNVVPVLGKADLLTRRQRAAVRALVIDDLRAHGILPSIYGFDQPIPPAGGGPTTARVANNGGGDEDDDADEEEEEEDDPDVVAALAALQKMVPFAVVTDEALDGEDDDAAAADWAYYARGGPPPDPVDEAGLPLRRGTNGDEDAATTTPLGRAYPWGVIEVENSEHCDVVGLLDTLFATYAEDLRARTKDVFYES